MDVQDAVWLKKTLANTGISNLNIGVTYRYMKKTFYIILQSNYKYTGNVSFKHVFNVASFLHH